MTSYLRKSGLSFSYKLISTKFIVYVYFCRQANLRYRELNESLETVHRKLGDARVCGNVYFVNMS